MSRRRSCRFTQGQGQARRRKATTRVLALAVEPPRTLDPLPRAPRRARNGHGGCLAFRWQAHDGAYLRQRKRPAPALALVSYKGRPGEWEKLWEAGGSPARLGLAELGHGQVPPASRLTSVTAEERQRRLSGTGTERARIPTTS